MIYLDANARSRLRPEVIEFLKGQAEYQSIWPANPSSVHAFGQKARALLKRSRKEVLGFLKNGKEVAADLVFTSGGTEACNSMLLCFLGDLASLAKYPAHIISSSIEHPAVMEVLKMLESAGWQISYVDPKSDGIVLVEDFLSELRQNTALVNLMFVNNETGAVQPVQELSRALRERGFSGPIVSDCVQALGKLDFSIADLFSAGLSALSISAHKIGALPGLGALVLSKEKRGLCYSFDPILRGGPQEQRLRGGTENLLAIEAFALNCNTQAITLSSDLAHKRHCRELLYSLVSSELKGVRRITPKDELSNANTLMLAFSDCRGDDLVVALDLNGLAASTGAACSSGRQDVSHVLSAMGFSKEEALSAVRFSLDWDISEKEIREAASIVVRTVRAMRESLAQSTEGALHAL